MPTEDWSALNPTYYSRYYYLKFLIRDITYKRGDLYTIQDNRYLGVLRLDHKGSRSRSWLAHVCKLRTVVQGCYSIVDDGVNLAGLVPDPAEGIIFVSVEEDCDELLQGREENRGIEEGQLFPVWSLDLMPEAQRSGLLMRQVQTQCVTYSCSLSVAMSKLRSKFTTTSQRKLYYMYSQACNAYRSKFFVDTNSTEIRRQVDEGENGDSTTPEKKPPPLHDLKFVSSHHFSGRHFVAKAFWTPVASSKTHPATQLIVHMRELCDPERLVLYYPGEEPVDGNCPLCEERMEDINLEGRAEYIHSCFFKHYQRQI